MLDLGSRTFFDIEVQPDPITLQRRYGSRDVHAVFGPAEVLAFQLLLGLFHHSAIKNPAFGKTNVLQCLGDGILFEFLHADKVEFCNRRAFLHDDNHHILVDLDTNILEEPGCKKRLDRLRRLFVIQGISDLDRQITEDGSSFCTLNTLDTNVLDRKRLESQRGC